MMDGARSLRSLTTLIDDVKREGRRTDRFLQSLPEEYLDYCPSARLLPARQLIGHLAATFLFVERAYRENKWDGLHLYLDLPAQDIATAVNILADARAKAVASAIACPSERLRATVTPFGFPEPAITFLRRAVDHEIHHRGELCVYATLFGSPVGDMYECERGVPRECIGSA
jgi:uncharacterized damage-inducible protein DinB